MAEESIETTENTETTDTTELKITVGDFLTKYIEGDVYMYDTTTGALAAQLPCNSPLFTFDTVKDLEVKSFAAAKTSSTPRIKVFIKLTEEVEEE